MTTIDFLSQLREQDIVLTLSDNGKLRVNAPQGALTPALKSELKERKSEIMAVLNQQQTVVIPRLERDGVLPMTAAQRQVWQLNSLAPESPVYNIHGILKLQGAVDATLLEQSIRTVMALHESLRTSFSVAKGHPHIAESVDWQLDRVTVADGDWRTPTERLLRQPFDLTDAPLLRGMLFRLAEDAFVLVFVAHHLVLDGWSFDIFLRDIGLAYRGQLDGAEPTQFVDVAGWLNAQSNTVLGQLEYWRERLISAETLTLPTTKPANIGAHGYMHVFNVPQLVSTTLQQISQRNGTTLYTTLLAAYAVLFNRLTEQTDILFGTSTVNRSQEALQNVIGYLNNTLIVRLGVKPDLTFNDLLAATKEVVLEAFNHQDVPFADVAALPELQRTPLARSTFAVAKTTHLHLDLPEVACESVAMFNGTVQADIALVMEEQQDGLVGFLMVRDGLFSEDEMVGFSADYQTILANIVANPKSPISDLLPQATLKTGIKTSVGPSDVAEPTTEIERQLLAIWRDVLDVDNIGVHDSFFALGGHSLLALHLFKQINAAFNINLPLATLFNANTIANLATVIEQDDGAVAWGLLVPIQPEGDKAPFFCIHGLTGDILWFRELGQLCAPNQPFYGIQSQGLDGVQLPLATIPEMAHAYIDAIRKIQPTGPYYLGGASFGGTVALEMAHQLKLAGEKVALLAMFDHVPADGAAPSKKPLAEVGAFVRNTPHWLSEIRSIGGGAIADRLRRKVRSGIKSGQEKVGLMRETDSADLIDYATELPEHRQNLITLNFEAITSYKPRPYSGEVTLFRAQAQPLFNPQGPESRWQHAQTAQLIVEMIPGSHEGMFKQPHVPILADSLLKALDKA